MSAKSSNTDARLILLDSADNVLGVARPIRAGETLQLEGEKVTLDQHAGTGFKIARRAIAKGEEIYKYGAVVGVANANIAKGKLVHVHNMTSGYMPNTKPASNNKQETS